MAKNFSQIISTADPLDAICFDKQSDAQSFMEYLQANWITQRMSVVCLYSRQGTKFIIREQDLLDSRRKPFIMNVLHDVPNLESSDQTEKE